MQIHFYTGKNGSGKSRHLYEEFNKERSSIAIINTPFTRFGMNYKDKKVLKITPSSIQKTVCEGLLNILKSGNNNELSSFLEFLNLENKISIGLSLSSKTYDVYDLLDLLTTDDQKKLHNPELIEKYIHHFDEKNNSIDTKFADDHPDSNDHFLHTFFNKKASIFSDNLLNNKSSTIFLEQIEFLKKHSIISNYKFIFRKDNQNFYLSHLSSGEQTLLAMYFYIVQNATKYDHIFIDEPENSLHPEWQFSIATLVNAAAGYSNENLNFHIATHSPLVISGGLSEYNNSSRVFTITNGKKKFIEFHLPSNHPQKSPPSLESILLDAYESIPPTNHHLSIQLNNLIHQYLEKNIPIESVTDELNELERKILIPKQVQSLQKNSNQIRLIELVKENLNNLMRLTRDHD